MQAVILAAGNGTRLGMAAGGLPKGLLQVGPCTLLEHQVRMLHAAGVMRVCVVVGFGAEDVRATLGDRCDYLFNARFDRTNSLHSLWLARKWVTGPFVLMNCDVLAHPEVLTRVLSAPTSALAYDATSGRDHEHMKVRVEGGLVRGMGKRLLPGHICGENVGVLYFDASTADLLFRAACEIVAEGAAKAWAPDAVDRIARLAPVRAVDVSDLPWCEIDFEADLEDARRRVWPAISARAAGAPGAPSVSVSVRVPASHAASPEPVLGAEERR